MKSLNLNLLPSQARFQAYKIKLEKKVRMILLILIICWIVAVAAVLFLNLISKFRVNLVQSQFEKARKDYMSMSDNIVTSQRLKYRAKLVGGVLNDRFEYGEAIGRIINLFPETIKINNFDLKTKGQFSITGETAGRQDVDKLELIVEEINSGKNEKFKSAKLVDLSVADSIWNFKMEVLTK